LLDYCANAVLQVFAAGVFLLAPLVGFVVKNAGTVMLVVAGNAKRALLTFAAGLGRVAKGIA